MSSIRRDAARSRGLRYRPASSAQLLRRILEEPALVAAVRALPGAVLVRLIDRIGLEDAGEIVALASDAQLAQVFEEDLWRADSAGADERFRPERFATWLEVLSEAGDEFVAQRLSALPRDFLTLAVHRLVLVLDIDALTLAFSEAGEEDADQAEKALESGLFEEWEEFRIIARNARVWDVLWAALVSLDRDHHALLPQVLEQCAAMDHEYIEDNGGLYEVLTSEEMLEGDVAGERSDRRAARGHVAPADARAFLALAKSGRELAARDAVTRAYFRQLPRAQAVAQAAESSSTSPALRALLSVLDEERVLEQAGAAARLPQGTGATSAQPLFQAAVIALRARKPELASERLEELAYLANVLMAGSAREGRRLRPLEALEQAIECCTRGLRQELAQRAPSTHAEVEAAARLLEHTQADVLFRMGYPRG